MAELFSMEVPLSLWIHHISTAGGFWSF